MCEWMCEWVCERVDQGVLVAVSVGISSYRCPPPNDWRTRRGYMREWIIKCAGEVYLPDDYKMCWRGVVT